MELPHLCNQFQDHCSLSYLIIFVANNELSYISLWNVVCSLFSNSLRVLANKDLISTCPFLQESGSRSRFGLETI